MQVLRLRSSRLLAGTLGLALALASFRASGQVTLTGSFLEVPIDAGGRLMAPGNASGVKFNPAGTGGASGIDFFVWGVPVSNTAIAIGGNPALVNGWGWSSGPVVTDLSSGPVRRARIAGSPVPGLELTRTVSFGVDDRVFVVTDTLTNSGGSSLTSVATLDAADPDQGDPLGCGSATRNDVVSLGIGTQNAVVASVAGCGYPDGLSVAFGSFSSLARVSAAGFDNTDPYLFLVPNDPGGAANDVAINLAAEYGTLGPGQTRSVTWFAAFSESLEGLHAVRLLPPCPAPAPAISAASSLCAGSTVAASVSGAPSSPSHYWSVTPFSGDARIVGSDSAAAVVLVGGGPGRVALECTVADNAAGCLHWLWKDVEVLAAPAPPDIIAPLVVAAGQASLSASVPAHPGSTYAWSIVNGTITAGNGTPAVTFTAGSAGELRLVVTETNASGCAATGTRSVAVAGAYGPCVPDGTTLCLSGSRFRVTVAWKTPDGGSGAGQAVPLAPAPPSSGWFWFFQATNLELVVKVLDGRGVNGAFWVLYGALSDVEYTVTVFDTATGATRSYPNRQGALASVADVEAFPDGPRDAARAGWLAEARSRGEAVSAVALQALATAPPDVFRQASLRPREGERSALGAGCVPSETVHCLEGGRFQVTVDWEVSFPIGTYGPGRVVPISDDTGCFWFFDARNVELAVKVLDGTAVNGKYWLFLGALSDVAYHVDVTDTATGQTRLYVNPAGTLASLADLEAFAP